MPPNGRTRCSRLTFCRASELLVTIKVKEAQSVPASLLIVDPLYLLAKTYFDCKEYHRAAHILTNTDPRSTFLKFYSLFLV